MNSSLHTQVAGEYLAIGAVINYAIAEVIKLDAFFHGMASILTAVAAVLSIYFTIKKNRK